MQQHELPTESDHDQCRMLDLIYYKISEIMYVCEYIITVFNFQKIGILNDVFTSISKEITRHQGCRMPFI